VNSGILEYKIVLKDLDTDIYYDEQFKNFHLTYDLYGVIGLRVFFKPSPLVIFFHNSSFVKELESSFSTNEIIKFYLNAKGKGIFKKSSGFRDFSGILNVFGSLLMTIFGLMTYKNRIFAFNGEKKFSRNVFIRLLILDVYFVLLMVSMYLYAALNGIQFSPHHLELYAVFCLVALLILNLWFLMGMFLTLWLRHKSGKLVAITLWALIMIGISEIRYFAISPRDIPSVKKTNLQKIKTLMETERKIREKILPLLKEGKKVLSRDKTDAKKNGPENG
jgi:hypothetical protein